MHLDVGVYKSPISEVVKGRSYALVAFVYLKTISKNYIIKNK